MPKMIEFTIKMLERGDCKMKVDEGITILQLKEKIEVLTGIEVSMQRVIFCGKVLKDNTLVAQHDLDGKALHLVPRAPPIEIPPPPTMSLHRVQILGPLMSNLEAEPIPRHLNPPLFDDQQILIAPTNARMEFIRRMLGEIRSRFDSLRDMTKNESQLPAGELSAPPAPPEQDTACGGSDPVDVDVISRADNDMLPAEEIHRPENTSRNRAIRATRPVKPRELADMFDELDAMFNDFGALRATFSHILRMSYNDPQNPITQETRLRYKKIFEKISELMHNFSHAYHTISDFSLEFPNGENVVPFLSSDGSNMRPVPVSNTGTRVLSTDIELFPAGLGTSGEPITYQLEVATETPTPFVAEQNVINRMQHEYSVQQRESEEPSEPEIEIPNIEQLPAYEAEPFVNLESPEAIEVMMRLDAATTTRLFGGPIDPNDPNAVQPTPDALQNFMQTILRHAVERSIQPNDMTPERIAQIQATAGAAVNRAVMALQIRNARMGTAACTFISVDGNPNEQNATAASAVTKNIEKNIKSVANNEAPTGSGASNTNETESSQRCENSDTTQNISNEPGCVISNNEPENENPSAHSSSNTDVGSGNSNNAQRISTIEPKSEEFNQAQCLSNTDSASGISNNTLKNTAAAENNSPNSQFPTSNDGIHLFEPNDFDVVEGTQSGGNSEYNDNNIYVDSPNESVYMGEEIADSIGDFEDDHGFLLANDSDDNEIHHSQHNVGYIPPLPNLQSSTDPVMHMVNIHTVLQPEPALCQIFENSGGHLPQSVVTQLQALNNRTTDFEIAHDALRIIRQNRSYNTSKRDATYQRAAVRLFMTDIHGKRPPMPVTTLTSDIEPSGTDMAVSTAVSTNTSSTSVATTISMATTTASMSMANTTSMSMANTTSMSMANTTSMSIATTTSTSTATTTSMATATFTSTATTTSTSTAATTSLPTVVGTVSTSEVITIDSSSDSEELPDGGLRARMFLRNFFENPTNDMTIPPLELPVSIVEPPPDRDTLADADPSEQNGLGLFRFNPTDSTRQYGLSHPINLGAPLPLRRCSSYAYSLSNTRRGTNRTRVEPSASALAATASDVDNVRRRMTTVFDNNSYGWSTIPWNNLIYDRFLDCDNHHARNYLQERNFKSQNTFHNRNTPGYAPQPLRPSSVINEMSLLFVSGERDTSVFVNHICMAMTREIYADDMIQLINLRVNSLDLPRALMRANLSEWFNDMRLLSNSDNYKESAVKISMLFAPFIDHLVSHQPHIIQDFNLEATFAALFIDTIPPILFIIIDESYYSNFPRNVFAAVNKLFVGFITLMRYAAYDIVENAAIIIRDFLDSVQSTLIPEFQRLLLRFVMKYIGVNRATYEADVETVRQYIILYEEGESDSYESSEEDVDVAESATVATLDNDNVPRAPDTSSEASAMTRLARKSAKRLSRVFASGASSGSSRDTSPLAPTRPSSIVPHSQGTLPSGATGEKACDMQKAKDKAKKDEEEESGDSNEGSDNEEESDDNEEDGEGEEEEDDEDDGEEGSEGDSDGEGTEETSDEEEEEVETKTKKPGQKDDGASGGSARDVAPTRELRVQRSRGPMEPVSDAYASGMPVNKRRRLRPMRNETLQSVSGNVEAVAEPDANTIRTAFREQVSTLARDRAKGSKESLGPQAKLTDPKRNSDEDDSDEKEKQD